jgi:hypothetical protein
MAHWPLLHAAAAAAAAAPGAAAAAAAAQQRPRHAFGERRKSWSGRHRVGASLRAVLVLLCARAGLTVGTASVAADADTAAADDGKEGYVQAYGQEQAQVQVQAQAARPERRALQAAAATSEPPSGFGLSPSFSSSSCVDCRGNNCTSRLSFIGDTFCDDGSVGLDFNCPAFAYDHFDCDSYRLPICDVQTGTGDAGAVGCFKDNSNRVFSETVTSYSVEMTLEWCAGACIFAYLRACVFAHFRACVPTSVHGSP